MHKLIKRFFEWDGIAPGQGGFVQAVPAILAGVSALGSMFGRKKKYMDNEALRQMYGPAAIGKDTTELTNQILNSPYGQQLMASAAEQGQGLQTDMAARAAASGMSPDTGASSGASDFQVSAATQAQTGLERQTRSGIYQAAMPIAGNLVQGRMQEALRVQGERNAEPTFMQRLGAAAGQVAGSMPGGKPAAGVDVAAGAEGASQLALPMMAAGAGGAPQLAAAPQVTMPNLSTRSNTGFESQAPNRMGPSPFQVALNSRSSAVKRGLTRRIQ